MGKDEKLKESDLRRACIHAAAHAMVARRLGYQSNWWVWEEPETKPETKPETRADQAPGPTTQWLGRHELIGETQPAHRMLIGLAGVVAVCLTDQPEISTADIFECLQEQQLSALDLELTTGCTTEQVARCRDLVLELLPGIREEARLRPDVATQVKRAKSRQYYA